MNPGKPPIGAEDKDLEQLEQLWREAAQDEPPELLDQAVLNRARHEVEAPRAWWWNLGWYHGLGTAAGVLLVVTVFIQMRSEFPDTPGAPAPMPALQEEMSQKSVIGRAGEAPAKTSADVPEMEMLSSPAAMGAAEPVLNREAQAAQSEDREMADDDAALIENAPERRADAAARTAAPATAAGNDLRYRALEKKDKDPESPQAWLERLEELRAAGDEAAFILELEKFIAAYPEHPLPEGWQE